MSRNSRYLRPFENAVLQLIKAADPRIGVEPIDLAHSMNCTRQRIYNALLVLVEQGHVQKFQFNKQHGYKSGHGADGGATYYKVK
jgi:Fe2+ or Zn2+ uptake regulation protein